MTRFAARTGAGAGRRYTADRSRPPPAPIPVAMLLSNLEFLPDRTVVRHVGLVQGSSVRSKHVGRDIGASLKNLFGGELKGYTELLTESREEATARMLEQARALGANGVINVRYSTSSIAAGAAEIFVYGSAVELADET